MRRFDTMIFQRLQRLQALFLTQRPAGYFVEVVLPSWGRLGWRGRLVVIDDDVCEDLLQMPHACLAEACLVLPKLVERMGL